MFHYEEIEDLRDHDPAEPIAGLRDPNSPEARALLAELMTQLDEGVHAHPRRRLVPRFGLAAAGAIAIAVVAALVLTRSGDRSLGVSEASATLHELSLAASADRKSDPPLRPGELYYRRTISGSGEQELWISREGAVAARGSEFNGLERLGPTHGVYATLGNQTRDHLSYAQMLDLPRDPDVLFGEMTRRFEFEIAPGASPEEIAGIRGEAEDNPLNQRMFGGIESFLVDTPVPADLRASFYDVLARLDGVQVLGEVPNDAGEVGLGITMPPPGSPERPEVLIFNQKTGAIIGSGTFSDGRVRGTAIVETGIVDKVGERP
jgi:hypothetical protein